MSHSGPRWCKCSLVLSLRLWLSFVNACGVSPYPNGIMPCICHFGLFLPLSAFGLYMSQFEGKQSVPQRRQALHVGQYNLPVPEIRGAFEASYRSARPLVFSEVFCSIRETRQLAPRSKVCWYLVNSMDPSIPVWRPPRCQQVPRPSSESARFTSCSHIAR